MATNFIRQAWVNTVGGTLHVNDPTVIDDEYLRALSKRLGVERVFVTQYIGKDGPQFCSISITRDRDAFLYLEGAPPNITVNRTFNVDTVTWTDHDDEPAAEWVTIEGEEPVDEDYDRTWDYDTTEAA